MRQDGRAVLDVALRRARESAYPAGEFVGQESFVSAGEILALARAAGIGPGVEVLDLCCGVAGPGRLVARELGCRYTGVDRDAGAVDLARTRAAGLDCRFEVAEVPPLPAGRYDVVMLLETMLAFPDKRTLVREVAAALPVGGRFAFTVEAGQPLSAAERARMPAADTVWLLPLPDLVAALSEQGLRVRWQADCTGAHRTAAASLLVAFEAHATELAAHLGADAVDDLLAAHRLWSSWLGDGRVRKHAVVAAKRA
jgi:SAM-dependent methyltransferase